MFLKYFLRISFFLLLFSGAVFTTQKIPGTNTPQIINIFGWHGQISAAVLKGFTKETGIKVIYDVYDSNEVLEAKLLAGHTGYDIVFPTAWPYMARQIRAKLYYPLDISMLPNLSNIDPKFKDRMGKADPGNKFAVPYTWGLVALGYNPDLIPKDFPRELLDSWALVYDETVLGKLEKGGVTLLEDPFDVFLTFYIFKGKNPLSTSMKLLKEMTEALKQLRPHIKKFATSLVAEQLANGELVVAMHWSEILNNACNKLKKSGLPSNIKVVLPREGTLMWIDCIGIPKDAPHIENAHKFINYLLRQDVAAQITNTISTATTLGNNNHLLRQDIRDNKELFPDDDYMKKVILPEIGSLQFQRRMARYFASIITYKE